MPRTNSALEGWSSSAPVLALLGRLLLPRPLWGCWAEPPGRLERRVLVQEEGTELISSSWPRKLNTGNELRSSSISVQKALLSYCNTSMFPAASGFCYIFTQFWRLSIGSGGLPCRIPSLHPYLLPSLSGAENLFVILRTFQHVNLIWFPNNLT